MYFKKFGLREGTLSLLGPGLFYIGIAFGIAFIFWPYFYYIKNEHIIAVGVFTAYRYLWLASNYVRSVIYHFFTYPKMRELAYKTWEKKKELRPQRIYFVIPSYMEKPWITVEMLQSLLSELSRLPCDATLVVATASDEEDHLFASMFKSHPVSQKVELVMQRQHEGKRVAMGDALRAVSRRFFKHEEDYNSVTVLMDGDSVLEPHTLEKVLAFFTAFPNLGAVTTNEVAYISSSSRWYKDWFNMKFGQRHILFGSHSLSKRVLTLTGRFSAFRTVAIVKEEFIEKVEKDYLSTPTFGVFRFLMGDDKSTWFQMLKEGWDMLYIPDSICYAMESRDENFIKVSLQLLFRWYGNTLRNTRRALDLGPDKVGGWFVWLAILDQKISMWSALVGITSAIILSIAVHPVYMPIYLAWVLMVRTLQSTVIGLGGHPISYRTVPLMLYNQWMGALVKIWVNFHLPHQKWKKGGTEQDASAWWRRPKHPLSGIMPNFAMFVVTLAFIFVLVLSERVVSFPDIRVFAPPNKTEVIMLSNPEDSNWAEAINEAITKAPKGAVIRLPSKSITIDAPIFIKRDHITLEGSNTKIMAYKPMEALIAVKGEREKLFGLAQDAQKGEVSIRLKEEVKVRDILLLRRPNDENFLNRIGSLRWKKRYPYIRQEVFEVINLEKEGQVLLDRAIFFDFPKDKTEVFLLKRVNHVSIRNLSIEYKPRGNEEPPPHTYENLLPDDKTDLILINQAAYVDLDNIDLRNAGRHPLNLDTVYKVNGRYIKIDGAWNKGKGGNGYLRLARSFLCQLESARVKNIRHVTIQWSSAYNGIRHLYSQVDVNFHGGYPHHNALQDVIFNIPAEHHWKGVVYIPQDASFAPPNGPDNIATGLHFVDH